MKVETLQDWNGFLQGCAGCCGMPACPEPVIICESLTRTRGCGDNDFTVALRLWEARRDFWVAQDPDERDPEDFPEAEPEAPEDYLDFAYGCFLPFVNPGGGPDDDVPTLYGRKQDLFGVLTTEGSAQWYLSGDAGFPSTEALYEWTGGAEDGSWTMSGTQARAGTEPGDVDYYCESTSASGDGQPWSFAFVPGSLPVPAVTCEAAKRTEVTDVEVYNETGSIPALVGCPLSDPGGFGTNDIKNADATRKISDVVELSSSLTKSSLITQVLADVPSEWPTDEEVGTSCSASLLVEWPKMSSVEEWPVCNSELLPQTTSATVTAVKVQVQFQIPDTWIGPEYHFFYDIYFFPDGWDPENVESPQPVLVSADNELTWTGPGDPENFDSWLTTPITIEPPTEPGENRIVNIRYACYNTRFGRAYQTLGEGYTPP